MASQQPVFLSSLLVLQSYTPSHVQKVKPHSPFPQSNICSSSLHSWYSWYISSEKNLKKLTLLQFSKLEHVISPETITFFERIFRRKQKFFNNFAMILIILNAMLTMNLCNFVTLRLIYKNSLSSPLCLTLQLLSTTRLVVVSSIATLVLNLLIC